MILKLIVYLESFRLRTREEDTEIAPLSALTPSLDGHIKITLIDFRKPDDKKAGDAEKAVDGERSEPAMADDPGKAKENA